PRRVSSWRRRPPPQQHHHWLRVGVGLVDRLRDDRHVVLGLQQVVRDAHGIQDRLDDAHAVAAGSGRRDPRLLLQQPDHEADRHAVFDGDRAQRVYGIEEAGVLDQQHRALTAGVKARADADGLVLLADADEPQFGIAGDRVQQALAADDIGYRHDEADAGRFDRSDNGRAGERAAHEPQLSWLQYRRRRSIAF